MLFSVDLQSGKPVYQQLVDQAKYAIASGRLRPGDRLPSVRDAAVDLRVNRNTVSRAYTELEREGLVYSRPGQGCFVAGGEAAQRLAQAAREELLNRQADELLAQARLFGLSREEALALVEARSQGVYGPVPGQSPPKRSGR